MLENLSDDTKSKLPDVAGEKLHNDIQGPLSWVGMKEVELPVRLNIENQSYFLPARADLGVSLDQTGARGIHMSRLFMDAQNFLVKDPLSANLLNQTLARFLETHQGLSEFASLTLKFHLPLKRKALKSDYEAFRNYPVTLKVSQKRGELPRYELNFLITYSSTCPASAALSRQLIQENFKNQFIRREPSFRDIYEWLGTTEGVNATPHAQRSEAQVHLQVSEDKALKFEDFINLLEAALQTPVQTIVKRVDEQEFALRNGQNLMFCEDAARRIKKALDSESSVLDYHAEVRHIESLHPHDAVAVVKKY